MVLAYVLDCTRLINHKIYMCLSDACNATRILWIDLISNTLLQLKSLWLGDQNDIMEC